METKISNPGGHTHTFSPTKWAALTAGTTFNSKEGFYIKNLSSTLYTDVEATGVNMTEAVPTSIYPGWNPELFSSIVIPAGAKWLYGK